MHTAGATCKHQARPNGVASLTSFCTRRCGISPFYCPRSNPDGHAVTFQCLDAGTVSAVEVCPLLEIALSRHAVVAHIDPGHFETMHNL
eukprot:6211216-Pleurochrysis_carterae.AAC.2